MQMDREAILQAIRFQAAENGGVPLGKRRFEAASGIRESAWVGKYWARWNDVLEAAGFAPQVWNARVHDEAALVKLVADLAIELGHYPTAAERNLRHRSDPSFPFDSTFTTHLGTRSAQLQLLVDLGSRDPSYKAVYDICAPMLTSLKGEPDAVARASSPGRVYLLRSGQHYKIGKTDKPDRRYREIQLLVPGDLEEIHVLETDDPTGIEGYWHRRFAAKRVKGEWFELSAADVHAFRSRGASM